MIDIKCPYCGKEQEINHDDGYGYEEDETHHQECVKCDKTFIYITIVSLYYEAEKADCLNNDAEHIYEPTSRYPLVLWNKVEIRCSICDKTKNIPYLDAVKYGFDMEKVLESQKQWVKFHQTKEANL